MLNFRQYGTGSAEPVIMLHGLFGSLENLAGIARPLADFGSVICVDLPNHGRSSHVVGGNLSKYAQMLIEWVHEQGFERIQLVGHSLGGKVAMEIALAQPEKVTKLAVLDISPVKYAHRHEQIFLGLKKISAQNVGSRSAAEQILEQYEPEAPVRSFLLKNWVRTSEGFNWRMNLTDIIENYSELICENRSGIYDGPVLFLKGENSNYIQSAHQPDIVGRFPNAKLRVIQGTEHWLHAEKPDLVARVIGRFLGLGKVD